jgi:hypothetical protein
MAKVNLTVHEMALIAASIEMHAEQIVPDKDDVDSAHLALLLELSQVHLKLIRACRDSLERDRIAQEQEHRE